MPQLVTCHSCGSTLYEAEELKPPYDIIQGYDGRCPSCNNRLSYLPKDIEVKHVNVLLQSNPFSPEKEKSSGKGSRTRTRRRARKTGVYVSSKPRSGGIWGTR